MPYGQWLEDMPQYCIPGMDRWIVRCPLICNAIIEPHCPDRVLRQFGMVQPVPETYPFPPNWKAIHSMDGRGKHDVNWSQYHEQFIAQWNNPVYVGTQPLHDDPQRTEEELAGYYRWYQSITRLLISRPTLAGEHPQGQPLQYQARSGALHKLVMGSNLHYC